jgi:hypothetical protein
MADVAALLTFAEAIRSNALRVARDQPDNRANYFAWGWAYAAEACLIAHTRTKDTRLLDWFVDSYEDVLSFRDCELGLGDDYRKRTTESWGSGRYLPGRWLTHVTMGGRIVFPSLVFAKIVLADRVRYAHYVGDAERYAELAGKVVLEYDEDFVMFPEVERSYYHMPLKGMADTINHVNSLVNCHILLAELTGNSKSRELAHACCEVFKDSLRTAANGAYEWPIRPYWVELKNNQMGERIWKARVSSVTAILAYKNGIVFTEEDMTRFAKTVTEIILVGENEFRDRVDLQFGRMEIEDRYRWRGSNIAGFLPWGEFDASIIDRILHIVATRQDVFPRGPLGRPPSAIAFAYMLNRQN